MPVDPESDLHWQAFRYISGEMSLDDAAKFDELLLVDQTAREAVASAVELVQTVNLMSFERVRRPRSSRRNVRLRAVSWLVTLAAAAALLAWVAVPSSRTTIPSEPDPSEVAIAWSGLRDGMDADWKALVAGSAPIEATDSALPPENDAVENSTERPLPSWLLSAASVPQAESPQEDN